MCCPVHLNIGHEEEKRLDSQHFSSSVSVSLPSVLSATPVDDCQPGSSDTVCLSVMDTGAESDSA